MAVKARFGRLPRAAPSLTSTLVSLANQYQSERDTNIETAWKNGGLFEGKPVTDSIFLKHWQDRMAGVSQDDPMWDYYNNLVHSYTFMIAESKMGQKYAEKSVSDGQMAAFYHTWAAKLPVDSEAYRHLMTQAAKFQSAATARATGGRARTASSAYANSQNATFLSTEQPYNVATNLITRYAVEAGYLDAKDLSSPDNGWSKLTNASGEDDPANFAALLTDLSNNKAVSDYLTQAIRANGDPHFSGAFNEQTLSTLADNARNGAAISYNRAVANGHKADATAAKKRMDANSLSSTIIRVSLGVPGQQSFVQQNSFYRSQMDLVLDPNSGASALERQTAVQHYRDWLGGQGMQTFMNSLPAGSLDPLGPNFNATAAGIFGRISNTLSSLGMDPRTGQLVPPKATGQTLKDDLYGFSTASAGASSDAVKTTGVVGALNNGLAAVAGGGAIEVRTDASGKPDPNGTDWNIFRRDAPEVKGNDNLIPVVTVAHGTYSDPKGNTLGGDQGNVRFIVAQPVGVAIGTTRDPATGAITGPATPTPGTEVSAGDATVGITGKQATIMGQDNVPVTVYGTYQGGRLVWSTVDPYAAGDTITTKKDGTIVHSYTLAGPPGLPVAGAPKAYFQPSSKIDASKLVSPDSKPGFNPATDKQTAFDSPMMAFANSSEPHMAQVTAMGTGAVIKAETEWFSDPKNWTPKMQQQAAQGMPTAYIVGSKAQATADAIQNATNYGFTPEQQNATRASLAASQEAARAAGAGQTLPQYRAQSAAAADAAQRADLASQLTEWGLANARPATPGGQWPLVPGAQPGQGTPAFNPLPKNWTVGDLVNQPGMNLAQASNLVFQITGGQHGAALPNGGVTQGQVTVPGNALNPGYTTPFPVAPKSFLPPAGSMGPNFRLGPEAIANPPPVPVKAVAPSPTPAAAPKLPPIKFQPPQVSMKPPPGVNPATWGQGGPGASGVS